MELVEARLWSERYLAAFSNQHDLDRIEEFFATEVVNHMTAPERRRGIEYLRQGFAEHWSAFPDGHTTIEDMTVDGDKVWWRFHWRGTHLGQYIRLAPTGRTVEYRGFSISRVVDGKIVERWGVQDNLGLMQQLGVFPTRSR
jgi:predicted ester cyclase